MMFIMRHDWDFLDMVNVSRKSIIPRKDSRSFIGIFLQFHETAVVPNDNF